MVRAFSVRSPTLREDAPPLYAQVALAYAQLLTRWSATIHAVTISFLILDAYVN